MSEVLDVTSSGLLAAWAMALGGLGALAVQFPRLRGTTLVAPWAWSLVALVAVAATEVASGSGALALGSSWPLALRFAAAMSTFCPIMALLGAKRPQDQAWQFIVVSLWGILSLPSLEWVLFGGVQEIHPARFWFLMTLISIGAANGIGTRFWPSSLLFASGQFALLSLFVPEARAWLPADGGLIGLGCVVSAWALLAAGIPRAAPRPNGLDRVWLDFRDAFGAVWSLRVAERMNATGALCHWPLAIGWRGLRACEPGEPSNATEPGATNDAAEPAIEDALRTLLRRFVSPEWIDARVARPSPNTSQTSSPVSVG
jgi:hypothetical protein